MSYDRTVELIENEFSDDYIQIKRSWALKFGLNEAIVLQQIVNWCKFNRSRNSEKHLQLGWFWTYNSYTEWQKYLPFWSVDTIKRTIRKLEKENLVVSVKLNAKNWTQEKWYRPNYPQIANTLFHNDEVMHDRSGQNAPMGKINGFSHCDRCNPRGYALGQNAPMDEGKMPRLSIDNLHNQSSDPVRTESGAVEPVAIANAQSLQSEPTAKQPTASEPDLAPALVDSEDSEESEVRFEDCFPELFQQTAVEASQNNESYRNSMNPQQQVSTDSLEPNPAQSEPTAAPPNVDLPETQKVGSAQNELITVTGNLAQYDYESGKVVISDNCDRLVGSSTFCQWSYIFPVFQSTLSISRSFLSSLGICVEK